MPINRIVWICHGFALSKFEFELSSFEDLILYECLAFAGVDALICKLKV